MRARVLTSAGLVACAIAGCNLVVGADDFTKVYGEAASTAAQGGAGAQGGATASSAASGGSGGTGGTASSGGQGPGGSGGVGGTGGTGGAGGGGACILVEGTATGLHGSIDLLNGATPITVTGEGTFEVGCLSDGAAYDVQIDQGPNTQICSVQNGAGAVSGTTVSDITITCEDHAFFVGREPAFGQEPWVIYDVGDAANVANVGTDAASGMPPWGFRRATANNYFIWVADDPVNGNEMWRSDLNGDTQLVKDLGDNGYWFDLFHWKGHVYYRRAEGVPRVFGRTDGTDAGTLDAINNDVSSVFPWGDVLLMGCNMEQGDGIELCSYDGTTVTQIANINPGGDSNPGPWAAFGDKVYFSADPGTGSQLWVTDGTAAGTEVVLDINPMPGSSSIGGFAELGGTLYFFAEDGLNGRELWKTDGTTAGTTMVVDIDGQATSSIDGSETLTVANGKLFFAATGLGANEELWVSEGNAATTMVIDIGAEAARPSEFFVVGDTVYFAADARELAAANRFELWESDGTVMGTKQAYDFDAPGEPHDPKFVAAAGGAVYVSARTSTRGRELYQLKNGSFQLAVTLCAGPCDGI